MSDLYSHILGGLYGEALGDAWGMPAYLIPEQTWEKFGGWIERFLPAWQDGGDAGAHGALVRQIFDDGLMTDGDACDIGDRVQRTRRAVEWNSQIARPWFCAESQTRLRDEQGHAERRTLFLHRRFLNCPAHGPWSAG